MKATDIIHINVTGTNGSTRNQRTISRVFNGGGLLLNDKGQVDSTTEILRNLPTEDAIKAPEFPNAQFTAAQAKGAAGIKEVQEILAAYQKQVTEVENSTKGGSVEVQIARSALAYLEEFHGFKQVDGDHFVIKLDDIDVVRHALPDGRASYLVAGTAVFGA